jgi:signal transduction histidine kinase
MQAAHPLRKHRPGGHRGRASFTLVIDVARRSSPPGSKQTQEQRLERLERLNDEFLATVAHEIRDPMTSCIGFAETLLRKGDEMTEEERREALETIAKTGRRLVQLLEDVLDVTRLEGGSVAYVMRPVDLNEVVADVLDEIKGRLPDADIGFDGGSEETIVEGDRDRLHQVVANLVSNAVKFSPGGDTVRIAVRADVDEVVLAVHDRGIGIAAEDVPKLFGRFARIPQAGATRIPGTGLGLFISKSIVDAHHGRIWVESEPGEGSTFFVALPA